MVNPNKKIKRISGIPYLNQDVILSDKEELVSIIKTLKQNYGYIYRSIRKENFYISSNETCSLFKEILNDDNEVVGFITANYSESNDFVEIQYVYVLPDNRNDELIIKEMTDLGAMFEKKIYLEYPSKDIINLLIRNDLAIIVKNRIAISQIPLFIPIVPLDDIKSDITREKYNKTCDYNSRTIFYDLDLCMTVSISDSDTNKMYNGENIENDLNDYNVISLPLEIDDEKYNCIEKRKNDKWLQEGVYFKKIHEMTNKYLKLDSKKLIKGFMSNGRILRPKGEGRIISCFSNDKSNPEVILIKEYVETNYDYIYDSIVEENYYIDPEDFCVLFKEILNDDNEVVGFIALNTDYNEENLYIVQNIYILPDYRNANIFSYEIDTFEDLLDAMFIFKSPNRDLIQLLIDSDLAIVYEDRYVASMYDFVYPLVPINDIKEGKTMEELENFDLYVNQAMYYDLELCGAIDLSLDNESKIYDGKLDDYNTYYTMSLPTKEDDIKYNCVEKRKNDPLLKDGTYFEKLRNLMKENDMAFQEAIFERFDI